MLPLIESDIRERIKYAAGHVTQINFVTNEWVNHPYCYPWWYSYGYNFKPKSILEFGVEFGFSLQSMIYGSGQVEYVCGVDMECYTPNSNALAERVIRNSGYTGKLDLITSNINNANIPNVKFDLVSLDCHDSSEIAIGWNFLANSGHCIIDDLGSTVSSNEPDKHRWVFSYVHDYIKKDQIEWCHYINNYRGQLIIKKK